METKSINKKNIIINVLILILGLIFGALFFGGSDNTENIQPEQTNSETIWTCSMHPQIRQPKEGDCPICGMDLIPLSGNSPNANPAHIEMSEDALKLANIQTSVVEYSTAEKEIFLQGKIEIDESRVSVQTVHFPGRIEKLNVSFLGERVNKGQQIAVVYSPQLVSAQSELLEALKSKTEYPQLLEAARNKLKLWKLSDSQISEIENTGKVIENFEIMADVSGFVTKKNVTVGTYIKGGDALFEITDLSRLWVVFDAYEKDLPFIKQGSSIEFSVSALSGKVLNAKVDYIDPVVDPQKRTVGIRAEISNTDNLLKPDMFVNGKLTASLSHKENSLVVPKSAVMWTGKRSVVYVKLANQEFPIFEFREIEIGESLGEFFIVKKGLKQGDEIVSNGTFSVDAAAQLNGKYSMMNPPLKDENSIPDFRENTSEEFKKQINNLLISYLALKESLVAGNADTGKKEANNILSNLSKVNSKLITGDSQKFWLSKASLIEINSKEISKTENIDTQRKIFNSLSNEIIKVCKSFGTSQKEIYIQFCPMANDDTGAFWLSTEKQIFNPYFGDMMLHCGETKDSIQ